MLGALPATPPCFPPFVLEHLWVVELRVPPLSTRSWRLQEPLGSSIISCTIVLAGQYLASSDSEVSHCSPPLPLDGPFCLSMGFCRNFHVLKTHFQPKSRNIEACSGMIIPPESFFLQ